MWKRELFLKKKTTVEITIIEYIIRNYGWLDAALTRREMNNGALGQSALLQQNKIQYSCTIIKLSLLWVIIRN